jgi:hypothetical protein
MSCVAAGRSQPRLSRETNSSNSVRFLSMLQRDAAVRPSTAYCSKTERPSRPNLLATNQCLGQPI